MPWARLDDGFPQHPKVIGLSDQAFRLHVTAICYSSAKLTDGVVPAGVLTLLLPGATRPAVKRRAIELVDANVWEQRDDGAYEIHDFLEYNPTRESVLADRDELSRKRREAGRKGGAASAESRRSKPSNGASKPASKTEANTQANVKQKGSPVPDPDPVIAAAASRARDREDDPALGRALTAFDNLVGSLNPIVVQHIDEFVGGRENRAEWVEAACAEAAENNGRSWRYVEAILQRWERDGFRSRGAGRSTTSQEEREAQERFARDIPR